MGRVEVLRKSKKKRDGRTYTFFLAVVHLCGNQRHQAVKRVRVVAQAFLYGGLATLIVGIAAVGRCPIHAPGWLTCNSLSAMVATGVFQGDDVVDAERVMAIIRSGEVKPTGLQWCEMLGRELESKSGKKSGGRRRSQLLDEFYRKWVFGRCGDPPRSTSTLILPGGEGSHDGRVRHAP